MKVRRFISRTALEGEAAPRFYLPVWKSPTGFCMEYWIFPLAPFIWIWRVTSKVGKIVWSDCLEWQKELSKHAENR